MTPERRSIGIGLHGAGNDLVGDEVGEAVTDFVHALSALNNELNGPVPSGQIGGKSDGIPRQVAYAVAEVARMLREHKDHDEAWTVETAWLAVLAGDIDDLDEHLAEERP